MDTQITKLKLTTLEADLFSQKMYESKCVNPSSLHLGAVFTRTTSGEDNNKQNER